MLSVELQDTSGRTAIQFDILPAGGLPQPIIDQQYANARAIAEPLGLSFYFLVTADRMLGWRVGDPSPSFDEPTQVILAPYASRQDLESGREMFLAEVVQAWLGDLVSRWKSKGGVIPGEAQLQNMGVLGLVHSAQTATTGSL